MAKKITNASAKKDLKPTVYGKKDTAKEEAPSRVEGGKPAASKAVPGKKPALEGKGPLFAEGRKPAVRGKETKTEDAAPPEKKAPARKAAAEGKETAAKRGAPLRARKETARPRARPTTVTPAAGLTLGEVGAEGLSSDNLVMQSRSRTFDVEPKGEHRPQVFPPSARDLPKGYNETQITLMVRDPEWAFVYWEVAPRDLERHNANESDLALRLYDVSGVEFDGANAHSRHDIVVGAARNWYIRLPAVNREWVTDLGVMKEDGSFTLLARSNRVAPPRATISELGPGGEWMTVEQDFERIFELSGGRVARGMGGSEAAAALGRVEFEFPRLEMGSEALASGAMLGREMAAPGRGFRLTVNTELIVYGSTEPDATVTIQGHPVRLNPDGAFRLRLALPDGEQEIPVKAVRSDGEESREITPLVSRKTRSSSDGK